LKIGALLRSEIPRPPWNGGGAFALQHLLVITANQQSADPVGERRMKQMTP
jgi:hypothetical protein